MECLLSRLRDAAWEPAPAVGEGQEYRSDADPETHASALVFGRLGAPWQRRRGELNVSRRRGTGNAGIVEHTEKDRYWGDGGDGSGENRLGQILMRGREQLRSEPAPGNGGGGAVGDHLIPSPRRGATPTSCWSNVPRSGSWVKAISPRPVLRGIAHGRSSHRLPRRRRRQLSPSGAWCWRDGRSGSFLRPIFTMISAMASSILLSSFSTVLGSMCVTNPISSS